MNEKSQLIKLAYELSEDRLRTQQSFAVASDQRSLVLAGVAIAAATFVAGLISHNSSNALFLISSVMFSFASIFAIMSALPSSLKTTGSKFSDIEPFLDGSFSYDDCLRSLATNNDEKVEQNELNRRKAAMMYMFAITFFVFGIAFSLISTLSNST